MDVAYLERLIAGAVAKMTRACQQAAPALDSCYPQMVDDNARERLQIARFELALAFGNANAAAAELARASTMLADYLKPEAR